MAVSEGRQYYALLTPADLHKCQKGLFTICEYEFPLYHKRTPSCREPSILGNMTWPVGIVIKISYGKTLNPYGYTIRERQVSGFIVCRHQQKLLNHVNLRVQPGAQT